MGGGALAILSASSWDCRSSRLPSSAVGWHTVLSKAAMSLARYCAAFCRQHIVHLLAMQLAPLWRPDGEKDASTNNLGLASYLP